MIARFAIVSWTLGALLSLQGCLGPTERQSFPEKPNFLIIITDDQRWDTVGDFMPITQARIFDQGVHFKNGYVTTPLCCPSRASILTGMYAHNHGVRTNEDPLLESTFVERLHEAGYFTGLVGKYLNSWDGSARPEFDFWVAFAEGEGNRYVDPLLHVNGSWTNHIGYITHLLRDYALQFLTQAVGGGEPFLLIFTPKAPHGDAIPAPGHENLYADLPPYRPPNYNEPDITDKPQQVQRLAPLTADEQQIVDDLRRNEMRTLKSVDEAIGEIIEFLEDRGELSNTVIFYLSDNGRLWGEHRLARWPVDSMGRPGKNLAYEPAIRVPFALRYPGLVPIGRIDEHLVANIDIAPTIYELAGLEIPVEVDGRSIVPLLQGADEWREELLLEAWPWNRHWQGLHTLQYVYVETKGDLAELYDLVEDPYQLQNLAYDPAYADLVEEMREHLQQLRRG